MVVLLAVRGASKHRENNAGGPSWLGARAIAGSEYESHLYYSRQIVFTTLLSGHPNSIGASDCAALSGWSVSIKPWSIASGI